MNHSDRVANDQTPRQTLDDLSSYRRALREYRHLVRGLGLDPRTIESILICGREGGQAHRRQILQSLRVELNPAKLRSAGYSSAAIAESEEWLDSVRKESP